MIRPRLTAEDVRDKVVKRMAAIDTLSPAQRQVVHDYGWGIVKVLRDCGVTEPKKQIMIINKVLDDLSGPYREMAMTMRKMPPPAKPETK